ncbi:pkinase-domain-containing protein [Phaffia rhodozyma]|uniref:non-specific serine/threonine protein kinase n=1 Tax=Phaffia rhodozyma TaxID=264483 RepID=A0A0F7SKQ1_PHARH|nr:pkinase-domain-containing protein [Phaffia rhodozyma]
MSFQNLSHLENYTEGDLIGQGSFGIIHKVTRKSDDAVFAQKQLNFSKMTTRDKQQLVAEVNILNKLQHPNIVGYVERILDSERGIIYLIMEYCGGGDLSNLIRECERSGRTIGEETIWNYFYQIALALKHCHSPGSSDHADNDGSGTSGPTGGSSSAMGRRTSSKDRERVLHRDLKPDNVFLDEGRENVKLGDFGLSKSMGAAAFANTYVGTPYYMSPELFSESSYDAKSDIWALGCVIYEMVALHPPFHQAKTHNDLANQLRSQRIPPLPRKVSPSLRDLIMQMLSFDPKLRPSAADLLATPMMDIQRRIREMNKTQKILASKVSQLDEREVSLATRERAVLERERRCSSQERRIQSLRRGLEADRELIKAERAKWDEDRRPGLLSEASSPGEMDGVVEIPGSAGPKSMVGSRVPRRSFVSRPLEEKPVPNQLVSGLPRSRDSCVFDLATPTKSAYPPSTHLVPSSIRRTGTPSRLASKSMGNLAAAARADRQREEEGGTLEAVKRDLTRSIIGSPKDYRHTGLGLGRMTAINANVTNGGNNTNGGMPRRLSPTNPFGAESRYDRPPSRPPLPSSVYSMPATTTVNTLSSIPSSSSSSSSTSVATAATATSSSSSATSLMPNTPAKYDPHDLENLPSPFLRRPTDVLSNNHSTLSSLPSPSSGSRPSIPRSRSTIVQGTVGSNAGGSLARMALGNAAAAASNPSSVTTGSHRTESGVGRPPTLQRVSRLSAVSSSVSASSNLRDRENNTRESVARAELAVGDAQRAMMMGH